MTLAPEPLYPKSDAAIWVLYDLRDPVAWERARADRQAWGRGLSDVHPCGLDHVLIAFRAGGASRALEDSA
jgi:hypothetical protein